MALYVYIKTPPVKQKSEEREVVSLKPQKILDKLSVLMFLSGVVIILFVIYPLLNYQIKLNLRQKQEKILSPIPEHLLVQSESVSSRESRESKVLASESMTTPEPNLEMVDNWFPSAPFQNKHLSKITDYTISIPKLKIEDAHVEIGGKRLKETLVQYGGTALPGEYGNTVIFGHSVLPHFFNPKNYETIFSTLPTLKKGDRIIVDFDGIRFVYQVERYIEIEPTDIEVLEQRFDRQGLTLITCVPPGTYWKRGVIQAYLQKI